MSLKPDWTVRVRILCALGLVVGFNVVLLMVGVVGVSALGMGIGWSGTIRLPVSMLVGAIVLVAIGMVALQARYGYRTALKPYEHDDPAIEVPDRVTAQVQRLAMAVDVPAPSVAVVESETATSFTVGSASETTIVVTTALLETLDAPELEAVLAHEIAHVANRDIPIVTAIAAVTMTGKRLLLRERITRDVLVVTWRVAFLGGISLLIFIVPLVLVALTYLIASICTRVVLAANAITLGLYVQAREFSADRVAGKLTGNPGALASALETLDGISPGPDPRLRALSLGIVPQSMSERGQIRDGPEEHWIQEWLPSDDLFGPQQRSTPNSEGVAMQSLSTRIGARIGTAIREHIVVPVTQRTVVPIKRGVVDPLSNGVRTVRKWRPTTHPPTEDRIERLRTQIAERH